jgi:hypothetical protein
MGPFPPFSAATLTCDLGRTAVAFADQPPPPAPHPREPVFAARFAGAALVLVAADGAPVALISRVTKGGAPTFVTANCPAAPAAADCVRSDRLQPVPTADPLEQVTTNPEEAPPFALWARDVSAAPDRPGNRLILGAPWARAATSAASGPAPRWCLTSDSDTNDAPAPPPTAPVQSAVGDLGRPAWTTDEPGPSLLLTPTAPQPRPAARGLADAVARPGGGFLVAEAGGRLLAAGEVLRLPGTAVTPEPPPSGQGIDQDAVEGAVFNRRLAVCRVPGCPPESVGARIDWGDGSPPAAGAVVPDGPGYAVSGRHCYETPGVYVATVSVLAGGAEVLVLPAAVTVDDAPFWLGRLLVRPAAGREFVGEVATLNDTNPLGGKAETYAVTVHWGDGRSSAGVVRPRPEGGFAVVGRHAYTAPGARTITVEASAAGGRSTSVTSLATVTEPTPGPAAADDLSTGLLAPPSARR